MGSSDKDYKSAYDRICDSVTGYMDFIENNEFAEVERERYPHSPETPDELADYVVSIIETAKNLNRILEQSPSSIYVTDAQGKTLRINKSFEEQSKIKRKDLIGKTTMECEDTAVYTPSAIRLALNEKRRIVVRQTNVTKRGFVVTGVPIYDEEDNIIYAVTNGMLNDDIRNIVHFLEHFSSQQSYSREADVIVNSSLMKSIMGLVDLTKDTNTTILIEGETGVGKNVLARYIHNESNRRKKKILEINCGAIPGALLESELFGYSKGAFTGANQKGKPGLIDMCEGGTLVLDEVSELPLNLQVKLLSFLQNRKFLRVGGVDEVETDVRVIATSNKDLEELVKEGNFRQDLFYRLNVVPILIPPLRARRDDIIPLAMHFLGKYSRMHAKNINLTDHDLELISEMEWPGNIRELENYIERLVLTDGNDLIAATGMRGEWVHNTPGITGAANVYSSRKEYSYVKSRNAEGSSADEKFSDKSDYRAAEEGQDEKERMLSLYRKYGSSYKVAKEMNMSQSTTYRRLKKYLSEE